MPARSKRALAGCLFSLLTASCIGGEGIGFLADDGLFFALSLDAHGERLVEVRGPYPSSENIVWVHRGLESGRQSRILRIDDERLGTLHPRYRSEARLETRISAIDAELRSCGRDGRSLDESKLEVPLDSLVLEDGTRLAQAFELDLERRSPIEVEPPGGLAVELPVHSCERGAEIQFKPFAASPKLIDAFPHNRLGEIEGLSALDEDHLVVFASAGVALVRRGGVLSESRDIFRIDDHFLSTDTAQWGILHGELIRRDWPRGPALAVLALARSERIGNGFFEMGGGWLRLQLSPEGVWSFDDKLEFELEPPEDRLSLRHVFVEPDERYLVVGRNLVLTASSATARPLAHRQVSFSARATYALDDGTSPHLVLLNSASVFEGDAFALEPSPRTFVISTNREMSLASAAPLPSALGTWIVGSSDGRLFRRKAPSQWESEPYYVTDRAAGCAALVSSCGQRVLTELIGALAPAPEGDGYLFGSFDCAALFWRRTNDPCAASIALPGLPIVTNRGGPRVLRMLNGRLYLGVGENALYELEFE